VSCCGLQPLSDWAVWADSVIPTISSAEEALEEWSREMQGITALLVSLREKRVTLWVDNEDLRYAAPRGALSR
jgi:TubC N-terminal docking domain